MANETNLSSTNSEELELDSPEGEEDVSTDETNGGESTNASEKEIDMEKIEKVTGRKFKDLGDFEKHYKELSSFVGKNPKELKEKAESFDKIMADANHAIKESKEGKSDLNENEVSQLKKKVEEMEFIRDYPESKTHLDIISSFAKGKNISLKEAYEDHLKDLISSKSESEKAKEQEQFIGVESKGRLSQGRSVKINEIAQRVIKSNSDEAKEDLVREFFKK
jgi:hypothetical protein